MYPYIELFGTKMYMTGLGIVLAGLIFVVTTYQLCKRYNQDFIKLFNRLPRLLISTYLLGLYTSSLLETASVLPGSFKVFSPYGYRFHLVGILIACCFSILIFLRWFRRNETKKVWLDILFHGFANALTVLWVFLLLGDNFIGREYSGLLSVQALRPESALVKFEGVYPIGLFLAIGAALINALITFLKLTMKKVGLGIWGFVGLAGLLMGILPFWKYPAHGVLPIGKITLDINYFALLFAILFFLLLWKKLRKPY